jgi:hypothetical protein
MDRFKLTFDLRPLGPLDRFCLLAAQEYNLGQAGNWFYYYRSAIQGLDARLYGVALHYFEVHAWKPHIRTRTETEYHVSSVFFNMDSAIECFIFAMNALGSAIAPSEFLDVSDYNKLQRIAPSNMLGKWNKSGLQTRPPLSGYEKYFPELQKYWQDQRQFLSIITEQHDVSKHRSRVYGGGSIRKDPPPGFFERLRIPDDKSSRSQFHPMEEIILDAEPKTPVTKRKSIPFEQIANLESVADAFRRFINDSCVTAFNDATSHVNLPHPSFLNLTNITVVKHVDIPLYENAVCSKMRSDVVGLILASGTVEFGLKHERIVPITRTNYYKPGRRVSTEHNFVNKWGDTWYVHPETSEKTSAWGGSVEFIGEMTEVGGSES